MHGITKSLGRMHVMSGKLQVTRTAIAANVQGRNHVHSIWEKTRFRSRTMELPFILKSQGPRTTKRASGAGCNVRAPHCHACRSVIRWHMAQGAQKGHNWLRLATLSLSLRSRVSMLTAERPGKIPQCVDTHVICQMSTLNLSATSQPKDFSSS